MNSDDYLVKLYKLNTEKEKKKKLTDKAKSIGNFSEKIRKSIVGICITGFVLHVLGIILSLPILVIISLLGCMPCVVILGPIQMISESISSKYESKSEECEKKVKDYESNMISPILQLPAPKNENIDYPNNLHTNGIKTRTRLSNIR